jgi:hypothetical protein
VLASAPELGAVAVADFEEGAAFRARSLQERFSPAADKGVNDSPARPTQSDDFASSSFWPAALFAGAAAGAAEASAAFVKNVVIVNVPVTEAPGAVWNLTGCCVPPLNPDIFKSPTLIIRERRPSRAKKSSTEKYGPSASISNGISK